MPHGEYRERSESSHSWLTMVLCNQSNLSAHGSWPFHAVAIQSVAVYTKEELASVKETHFEPVTVRGCREIQIMLVPCTSPLSSLQLGDKAAYAATRIARWAFDLISGYSPLKAAGKPITPDVYFLRFM